MAKPSQMSVDSDGQDRLEQQGIVLVRLAFPPVL
jgi:hypothetical protein